MKQTTPGKKPVAAPTAGQSALRPPRGANRPIVGFFFDDVEPTVQRWRAYAQAYQGQPAERFGRLADQLQKMVADGRCTFTYPVKAVAVRSE